MKKLTIEQNNLITQKIKVHHDTIVLLEYPVNSDFLKSDIDSNVYCIDMLTNIYWQISAEKGKIGAIYEEDPFVYIELDNSNTLKACRFSGNEYIVDIKTGIAKQIDWNK